MEKVDSKIFIHLVGRNGMYDKVSRFLLQDYPLVEREYMRFVTNEKLNRGIVQFCPTEAYILEAGIIDSCDYRTAGDIFYNGDYVINIFIDNENNIYNDAIISKALKIINRKLSDRNLSFYGKKVFIFADDFIKLNIDIPIALKLTNKFLGKSKDEIEIIEHIR